MPVLGGVFIARGKTVETLLRGVYMVDKRDARQIYKLFVDSAGFMGPKPPKDFKMSLGEIFYKGGEITEVRLAGRLSPVISEKWGRSWPPWRPGRYPHFEVTDGYRLALSPRDQGRSYVAAVRIGEHFLLSWDLSSSIADQAPADADVRHIRIAPPVEIPVGRDENTTFEAAIKYLELMERSANDVKTFLSHVRDGAAVHVSRQFRPFRYTYGALLKQRIDDGVPHGAVPLSFSMKKMKAAEMRKQLVAAVAAITRDYLVIQRGRKEGSKSKNRNDKSKKIERDLKNKEKLKKKILRAITTEYKRLCRKSAPAEAESKVNINVVAARLKTDRKTFYNWRRRAGLSFDDLKTKAIKRVRN